MSFKNQLLQSLIMRNVESLEQYCLENLKSKSLELFLREEKILLCYLQLKKENGARLTSRELYLLDAYNEVDIFIDSVLNKLASMKIGTWSLIKGKEYSAYYPLWMRREVRDMDVIFEDKNDYILFLEKIFNEGFLFKFIWIMKSDEDVLVSSLANTDKKIPFGYKYSDRLWIEAHLKKFPISFFTSLDFFSVKKELPHVEFMLVLILAEFVNRDGVEKSFSIRDVLDIHYLLQKMQINNGVSERLVSVIKDNALDVSLCLLKLYLLKEDISIFNASPLKNIFEQCIDHELMGIITSDINDNSFDYELFHSAVCATRRGKERGEVEALVNCFRKHQQLIDVEVPVFSFYERLAYLKSGVPVKGSVKELHYFLGINQDGM